MITESEWASIRSQIESVSGVKRGEYFITSKVLKRDVPRKLVWIAELGSQPVPVVGFEHEVKYYDTTETGVVTQRTAKIEVVVPRVGQIVLVARELGTARLPRCLGVIQGTGWITTDED